MPNLDRLRQFIQTLAAGGEELFSGGGPVGASDIRSASLQQGENRGVGGILSNFARMRGQGRLGADSYNREARADEAKIGLTNAQTESTRALGGLRGAQRERTNVQTELAPLMASLQQDRSEANSLNVLSQIEARSKRTEVAYQEADIKARNAQTNEERLIWQKEAFDRKQDLAELTELHKNAVAMRNAATGEKNASTMASIAPSRIAENNAGAGLANTRADDIKKTQPERIKGIDLLNDKRQIDIENAPLGRELTQSQINRNNAIGSPKPITASQRVDASSKMMKLMKERGNSDEDINDAAAKVMAGEDPSEVLSNYGLGDAGLFEDAITGVKEFFGGTKPSKPVTPAPVRQTGPVVTRTANPTVSQYETKQYQGSTYQRKRGSNDEWIRVK